MEALERELRKLKKAFVKHTETVRSFYRKVDVEMLKKASPSRDVKIARLLNRLEMSNDRARRFDLDIKDF